MKKLLLNLVIALNKNSLRINSKYTLIIKVLEHNHPLLEDGQELASIEIDTRVNKVDINYLNPIKDAYLTNEFNDEERFYNTLYHWIRKFGMYIENGDVSLRYLIDNSGKKVENPTYEQDGKKMLAFLHAQKDYLVHSLVTNTEGGIAEDEEGILLSHWAKLEVVVIRKYHKFGGNELAEEYD